MGRGNGQVINILYGKTRPRRSGADSGPALDTPTKIEPCTDLDGDMSCDGFVHYVAETVAECCGDTLSMGECCGSPVPAQEWVAIGYCPNLPEGLKASLTEVPEPDPADVPF